MGNVVIIPVHNQLQHLIKCVESVISKTDNLNLIIVDDGSEQETSDWIIDNEQSLGYVVIRHEQAMGFSKSCNDGIDYAMANYDFSCLCLLNSDTEIITDNWFTKVSDFFETDDKIGVAGVMSDNALAQTVRNKKLYLSKIDSKPTVYSYLIHGFCYFIGRSLIMEIGKLDEVVFPHYGSEDDYSLKSISEGFINLLVGSVFVHHVNNASYTEKVRAKFILHTVPDLKNRWTSSFVDNCGTASVNAANYINNK